MEQNHIETDSFMSHHHSTVPHNLRHPDEHDQFLAPPKPGQINLRTLSKSEPHLEIPHLLVSQDDAHPSVNKIMSNYSHVHDALKTPILSHPNLKALEQEAIHKELNNPLIMVRKERFHS
ncbi:hypothetical protein WR25_11898 [Diploscapter pachys]|uniref:Uncharacterized protein n=1 Tax=Diploscapter pachys TaxID=2018661 RepID=A0A2A2JAP8_9BILA|nr:hypothetical protein WR25_11898 [Diploscapter pachys]